MYEGGQLIIYRIIILSIDVIVNYNNMDFLPPSLSFCLCLSPLKKKGFDDSNSPQGSERSGGLSLNRGDLITMKNKRFRDHYIIGNMIGDGTGKNGEIRKCKSKKNDKIMEVKFIKKDSMNEEELE